MDENYECFSVCCYYCCLLLLGLNIKIRTDWRIVSVKFHVRDGRTDEETRLFVRPSVRPSVRPFARSFVSMQSMGERTAMLHRNLRGR